MKKKSLIVTFVTLAIALTSLGSYSKSQDVKNITEDYESLVAEANNLFDKYYNPNELGEKDSVIYTLGFHNAQAVEEDGVEEDIAKEYWRIAMQNIYADLSDSEKQGLYELKEYDDSFSDAYDIFTGNYEVDETIVEPEIDSLNRKAIILNSKIKRMVGVGTASLAFATMSSMISGIASSSWIPFIGWAIAVVLVAALIIFIVCNWSYIRDDFASFMSKAKKDNPKISSLLDEASSKSEEQAKSNPDVAEDATSVNQMKDQLQKDDKLKREVKRVDPPHNKYGKPHIHMKDNEKGLNWDGTIHDKNRGRANPTRYVWDWLHRNGWCQNGIK